MMHIVQALDDANLLGPWFAGPSWATWKAVLKAAFALKMDSEELALFRAVAERDPPKKRVRELWVIAGRRAGKDSVASAVACYFSAFIDWHSLGSLRPGELASVLCLATDKPQAQIIKRYTQSYFAKVPLLRPLVERLGTRATLKLFEEADHSFHVPARTGRKDAEVRAELLDAAAQWLDKVAMDDSLQGERAA